MSRSRSKSIFIYTRIHCWISLSIDLSSLFLFLSLSIPPAFPRSTGELFSLDEEQRIALFEMVKDGSVSIEEAHAAVKRTKPKQFMCKHVGSVPGLAPTLKNTLTDAQALQVVTAATARLKKLKLPATKVKLHCSTISLKIVEEDSGGSGADGDEAEVILENEPISQIAYVMVVPGDKKRVAYITSYSRLGLLWTHVFQVGKSKEVPVYHSLCVYPLSLFSRICQSPSLSLHKIDLCTSLCKFLSMYVYTIDLM